MVALHEYVEHHQIHIDSAASGSDGASHTQSIFGGLWGG